ncbi:MAG: HD domain-containing protein [Bacillaceae bacterium]
MKVGRKMIIKDAIHGIVEIENQDIIDLIHTPYMQRLRHIKQQGNTYFLQPNAIHNRLEHSIGVYILSEKFANIFEVFTPYEKKVLMVSALLHDIGHGPFSHCFQSIFKLDHGDITVRMVNECAEIKEILQRTPSTMLLMSINNIFSIIIIYLAFNVFSTTIEIESSTFIQMEASKDRIGDILGYYNFYTTICSPIGMFTGIILSSYLKPGTIIMIAGLIVTIYSLWKLKSWKKIFYISRQEHDLTHFN